MLGRVILMETRKISYILFAVSFVMIIAGGFSSFLIGLREDKELTNKRMVVVSDQFEDFSTNTSLFENVRDNLYVEVLSNLFFDTMQQNDENVKTRLSNYENMVDEITKQVKELDKLCNDVYYPDSSVNNKCSNYKVIYEQVVNYFMNDINIYNENIKKFNEFQKSINGQVVLKEYSTNKKFIDYNDDKEFAGKEE